MTSRAALTAHQSPRAKVSILMQLGFLGALIGSIRLPYDQFNADIIISASDMNTMADGSPLPRQRM